MSISIGKAVKNQIQRYKETGALPKEKNSIPIWKASPIQESEEGIDSLDNLPTKEAYESEDAGLLAECLPDFLASLTTQQRKVFDLHMKGGLTQTKTAQIMGISQQVVGKTIVSIRTKCRAAIEATRKFEKFLQKPGKGGCKVAGSMVIA